MANGQPTNGPNSSGYTNGNGAGEGNAHAAGTNDKAHASGTSDHAGNGYASAYANGNDTSSGNGGGSNGNGYGAVAIGGTARWQLILSALAVMTAIGGALLTLLVNINTLSNTASNLSTRVAAQEAEMGTARERRSVYLADMASIHRDLVEIETQFCAEDALRNLMHANDLRDFAMLWAKTMGGELPIANAYYPHIGRCQADAR